MYGIASACCASNSRSSQASRVFASAGAFAMIGTRAARALFTALPIAPDEPSTCSRAGEIRSMNATAPSAASTGSVRATFLISDTACFTRWIAGCDFHPNAFRRKRAFNSHLWGAGFGISSGRQARDARATLAEELQTGFERVPLAAHAAGYLQKT